MRTREILAGTVLIFVTLTQLSAWPLSESEPACGSRPYPEGSARRVPEKHPTVAIPEPSSLVSNDRLLATAYFDAMRILGNDNQCSMFFGGSEASVSVFSNFIAGVRRDYLPSSIGLKMSGDYTNILNAETRVKYRLFDKVSVNTGGPFYKLRTSPTGPFILRVGSFPPNSREARVLMLLHELGHLMNGPDGKWLLPDDGSSMTDSLNNTRKIESICGDQIRALKN